MKLGLQFSLTYNPIMKKLIIGILISFGFVNTSFAEICDEASNIQDRNGFLFLPNQTKPYSGESLCSFDNEQFKTKGRYNNGLKSGLWTEWQNNGIKVSEEIYNQGELQSKTDFSDLHYQKTQKIYYSNGIESLITTWSYYSNLQMKFEMNTKNGIFHGMQYDWHENGQKKAEGNYINGKVEGNVKNWYSNGNLKSDENYIYDKLEGSGTTWYENGQKKTEGNYALGLANGEYLKWYENGQIEQESNYTFGDKDGLWKTWYENGQIKQDRTYENNIAVGKVLEWYSDGQLRMEAFSQNNKPLGKQTYWWSNGQKELEFTGDENGLPIGDTIKWHENGQMRARYSCIDGVPDGEATSWGADGEMFEGNYENGSGFSSMPFKNANNKKIEVTFNDGIQIYLKWFHKNGKRLLESKYVNGKPVTYFWDFDGAVESEKELDYIQRTLCVNLY